MSEKVTIALIYNEDASYIALRKGRDNDIVLSFEEVLELSVQFKEAIKHIKGAKA